MRVHLIPWWRIVGTIVAVAGLFAVLLMVRAGWIPDKPVTIPSLASRPIAECVHVEWTDGTSETYYNATLSNTEDGRFLAVIQETPTGDKLMMLPPVNTKVAQEMQCQ